MPTATVDLLVPRRYTDHCDVGSKNVAWESILMLDKTRVNGDIYVNGNI